MQIISEGARQMASYCLLGYYAMWSGRSLPTVHQNEVSKCVVRGLTTSLALALCLKSKMLCKFVQWNVIGTMQYKGSKPKLDNCSCSLEAAVSSEVS